MKTGSPPHVLIYEPRVEGHHLSYLRFLTEDLLGAGFRLSLAVDPREAPSQRIQQQMGDLLPRVEVVPVCDKAGLRAGDGQAGSVAACLEASRADSVFLNSFDEIASSVLRKAAFGRFPPENLRGRLGGIYVRPRFLAGNGFSLNGWLKSFGFSRLARNGWFNRLLLLDPYLHAQLRQARPELPAFFLPDPYPDDFASDAAEARRQFGISAGQCVFLFYGGGYRRKGLPLTVAAMLSLPASHPAFLLFAGHEPEDAASREGLATLAGRKRAKVLNRYVSAAEEKALFAASDFVLLPYIRHFGSSGVLARAAGAGRPVVASDEELVGRLVRERGLGLLFPSGNAGAFASALLKAAASTADEIARWRSAAQLFAKTCSREAFRSALLAAFDVTKT